ncbi:MAG TPA: lipoate--protein ligase family protein [Chlamydiales bacterium]|nr:lipoate--protein ligase family protein [Chlamydiales bacterium]
MGISGQPEALLNLPTVERDQIPIIKRFSGGGTVIVDENTLFITFIMAKEHIDVAPFPEPILRWSADLYRDAWKIPQFHLRENDYCIGEKKCGGNAQYIKKDRWLHHTSFLWDYSEENMAHLRLPEKRPQYRKDRSHSDFLTRLKVHSLSPNTLIQKLKETIVKRLYMEEFDLDSWIAKPHRQATELIKLR